MNHPVEGHPVAPRSIDPKDMALAILFVIVFAPPLWIFMGWTVSTIWTWHLVPLGAPAIPTAHAIGIWALLILLKPPRSQGKEQRSLLDTTIHAFCRTLGGAVLALAFARMGLLLL